jgi:sigma-B regulation protein RsbU (phosphoserine phosphatase)
MDDGQVIALVVVEAPPGAIVEHRRQTVRRTILFASVGVVVVSTLSLIFVRALLRPVQDLVKLARRLQEGDYDSPVECCGVGEIGLLAQTMEQMRQALSQRIGELRNLNLDLAQRVQSSIIPGPEASDFLDVAVTYRPYVSVGGDYAHVHFGAPDILYVSIGDVTGHGVPAALLVNRVHGLIDQLCREELPPDEMLRRINTAVLTQFHQSATFMTFLSVNINLRAGQCLYANAGHPPGLLLRRTEGNLTVEEFPSQCTFLGIDETLICDVETMGVARLAPGDRVLLYTDGVIEASPSYPDQFGQEGVLRVVRENQTLGPQELVEKIMEEALAFARRDLHDDALIVLIEVKETSGTTALPP